MAEGLLLKVYLDGNVVIPKILIIFIILIIVL